MGFLKSIEKAFRNKVPSNVLHQKVFRVRHLRHKYGLTRKKLYPRAGVSSSSYADSSGDGYYGPTGSIVGRF